MSARRTMSAIITHQGAAAVAKMIRWWESEMPDCDTLVVYGGREPEFARLEMVDKVFVSGEGHRTKDHQRERQSYAGALTAVAEWLKDRDYQFVNLLEFDVVPLTPTWVSELEEGAVGEGAGLLCHHLKRVDGTFHPHFLNHSRDPEFAEYWRSQTVRPDPEPVFSMIGCHSFWRRDAFEAVAARPEPFPIYLELYLPTLAHHLGFRVREATADANHMRPEPVFGDKEIAAARAGGATAVHPVKNLWDE